MYVCMYVRMYVCMYVYIHVYIYTSYTTLEARVRAEGESGRPFLPRPPPWVQNRTTASPKHMV